MTRNLLRLRGLRIVAAVSVLQAFLVGTVLACQCGHGGTPEGLLQSNDAVFVGVAMRTVAVAAEEFVTTFVVVEGFKGVRAVQSVRVRHREKSESCGVRFETYGIYRSRPIDSGAGAACRRLSVRLGASTKSVAYKARSSSGVCA